MIKVLEVKNFKSIKDLKLSCSKINIFIGEPNAGKSNILESLGILSFLAYGNKSPLRGFVRHETLSNLFFDEDLEDTLQIRLQDKTRSDAFEIIFTQEDRFQGIYFSYDLAKNIKISPKKLFEFDYIAKGEYEHEQRFERIKFYRFEKRGFFPEKYSSYLLPPFGSNLPSVLKTHKSLKQEIIDNFLKPFNYKLMFKPQENKIEIVKQYDDILISVPYALISDTFQRLIFYLTAILSNKDSVLVFEEPESHTFPYYTKFLAECIALDDKNNQFFISTHNPYFLFSVLEKSKKDDIAIFVVYMENFETKLRKLTQKEIEEAMNIGLDFFFNIDRFKNEEQG